MYFTPLLLKTATQKQIYLSMRDMPKMDEKQIMKIIIHLL